ncbi:MAG TPA: hypothetical protein VF057_07895 [Thermoanaerobaculia bacterium]
MSGWEWIALAGVAAVYCLIRLPLFRQPGLLLGWHSDAAVFGLMAREMSEGTFHFFWWGQSYLGTLTQMFGVVGGWLVAPFAVEPAVGPLAMRIGTSIEWLLMIVVWWLALRIAFTPAVAIIVSLLLALGPDWFFWSPLAPRGTEMHLLMSGAIFVIAAHGLRRRADWLIFGLLSGIGWWMHQGVVFMIAAVFAVIVLRSEAWAIARSGPSAPSPARRLAIRVIDVVLLTFALSGALHHFMPRVPAFFLHRPVAEPLVAWLLFRAILEREAWAALWRGRSAWLSNVFTFAGGALVAYSPVIVARMRGAFEGTYGVAPALRTIDAIAPQAARLLRTDLWTLMGVPASVFLVVLLVAHAVRRRRALVSFMLLRPSDYGLRGIAAASIVLAFLFYLLSPRAFAGAVRYLAPALVVLFAFAIAEAEAWWLSHVPALRAAAAALVVALIASYTIDAMRLVDSTVAGREEGRFYTGPALARGPSFDPRPVIAAIDRGGWKICYAPFAVGMNLEWLMDRRVQFISHGSFEPRRALAARLRAQPGPKCRVDWSGVVTAWEPAYMLPLP